MATWNKIDITLENRQKAKAQAPVIVSASRSTDIPAFYADWFLYRMKEKGYSAWTNPFNGVKSYVSYNNTRFIVFWSKNPRSLIDSGLLDYLKERNINCYIQYSLNDYEEEGLEKGVKPLDYRIETFNMLVDKLGKGSVVWRFDPLMLTPEITIDKLLKKIENIGDQLKDKTEKLVFSFADISIYNKVKNNLIKNNIAARDWEKEEMIEFANKLIKLNNDKGWKFKLATCGEAAELEGIEHNRCIDGDLITQIAWRDQELMNFMKQEIHEVQYSLFEPDFPENAIKLDDTHYYFSKHKKDPGQRAMCGCMAAKDIGEYDTCVHLCEYCYANTSKLSAVRNYNCHKQNPYSETITGK